MKFNLSRIIFNILNTVQNLNFFNRYIFKLNVSISEFSCTQNLGKMFIFRLGLLTHLLANEKTLSIYNLSHFTAAKYSFQYTTLLNLIECTAYIFIFRALFSLEFVPYFLCFRSSIFKFCCLHCGEYNQSNSIAMERLMIPKSDNDVHISNPTDAMKDIKKNCYHFSIEILS